MTLLYIKIPLLQVLFGISSMGRRIEEMKVNMAYGRFLGSGFTGEIPHFSTFGKNCTRHFRGTALFEQIVERILLLIIRELPRLLSTSVFFGAHSSRGGCGI